MVNRKRLRRRLRLRLRLRKASPQRGIRLVANGCPKEKCFAASRHNVLSKKRSRKNASPRSGIRLVANEMQKIL